MRRKRRKQQKAQKTAWTRLPIDGAIAVVEVIGRVAAASSTVARTPNTTRVRVELAGQLGRDKRKKGGENGQENQGVCAGRGCTRDEKEVRRLRFLEDAAGAR